MGHNEPSGTRPSINDLKVEAEAIVEMVTWFFETYEDPAENCSYESAEGGYQYIWGGPCQARDELEAKFPGADESNISRAVEIIERSGTDWANQPPNDPEP